MWAISLNEACYSPKGRAGYDVSSLLVWARRISPLSGPVRMVGLFSKPNEDTVLSLYYSFKQKMQEKNAPCS